MSILSQTADISNYQAHLTFSGTVFGESASVASLQFVCWRVLLTMVATGRIIFTLNQGKFLPTKGKQAFVGLFHIVHRRSWFFPVYWSISAFVVSNTRPFTSVETSNHNAAALSTLPFLSLNHLRKKIQFKP